MSSPYIKSEREKAEVLLNKLSFPTNKKDEDFRYTRLNAFQTEVYTQAHTNTLEKEDVNKNLIKELESYILVFVDGVFMPPVSNYPKDKLVVLPFSEAVKDTTYQAVIEAKYNTLASIHNDYFSALNISNQSEGTFIYVPKKTVEEKPIELLYLNSSQEFDAVQYIRNLFVVEDQAQVSITKKIQTLSSNKFLTNSLTEIFVGKNAHVRLYNIQNDVETANLIDQVFVGQEQDSEAYIHTFTLGGYTTRNVLTFDQKGENINSTLKGITIIGANQEVGNHTLVLHNQPNCESHELYRGIFTDTAHGIFSGKIKVDRIAQKTNAFQQNNNILLSDKALIDTKPQLEIFADDVKCSHGCTIGQLDTEALFYMKQRGIHDKEAKALLMFAFCSDVMDTVTIPELKNKINRLLAEKLQVNIDFEF